VLLRLGDQMLIADRLPGGVPSRAYGVSGWGIPSYGGQAPFAGGPMKPMPVGARYFCGDCDSVKKNEPVAQGNIYNSTKSQYQEAVTAHYTEAHADLHYPVDQAAADLSLIEKNAVKAKAARARQAHIEELLVELVAQGKLAVAGGQGGSVDLTGSILPVTRPRELPDFTEFDFPDANLADAAAEELELDQLISIAARQGRRFLGVELQNLGTELGTEFATIASAAISIDSRLELNTRTGTHNLDDPEQLWRQETAGRMVDTEPASAMNWYLTSGTRDPPPGGRVYVAPRLFYRFLNNMDRQVDIGDLFALIATVAQPLSTFLLFELLEEFSGLFGLT